MEIAQEHANDEPDRENEVFLVNYNEWREVGTLDLEQNYFAIDDPYADGDFRLLHLQNQIKDITPAGVHYDTYEDLRLPYMKQSGKWRICPSTRKITSVPIW